GVVAGREDGVGQLGRADPAADRRLLRRLEHVVVLGADGLLRRAEPVDGVVLGDPGEPGPDVALERLVLFELALVPDVLRVDVAVHHHPLHALGEERRVGGAEVGAVGEAVPADLLLAEGGADRVDVARRVGGAHVRQHPAELLRAVLRVLPGPGDPGQFVLPGLGDVGGPDRVVVVRVAGDRGLAGADSAGVEADDVVLRRDVGVAAGAEPAGEGGAGAEAGAARPARARAPDALAGLLAGAAAAPA